MQGSAKGASLNGRRPMNSPFGDRGRVAPGVNGTITNRTGVTRRDVMALSAMGIVAAEVPRSALAAGPAGQLTWAVHISLAPTWFDPAETPGIITPFMMLYAVHDAVVKPMPGQP